MRKLILHLGTHKTGTSSVQECLYNNQKILEDEGISSFFTAPNLDNIVHKNATNWFIQKNIATYGAKIRSGLAKALSLESKETVIMSSEVFSWIFDEDEISNFKKELDEYFDEIHLVIYLRRQDKMAVSHYQQAAKTYIVDGKFYTGNFTALPKLDENAIKYLDYYSHYVKWADIFGDKNIKFKIFKKESLKGGDIVLDFLDYLNINETKIKLNKISSNESYSFMQTKVNHLMREAGMNQRDTLTQEITNTLDKSTKMTPSSEEAKQFYSFFIKSNQKLNKRFKISSNPSIFDEDFESYPNRVGNQYWDEDSANKAILDIFKVLKSKNISKVEKVNEKEVINSLRDLALQIESQNISLAYEIMKVAYKFRPSGDFIKQKIVKYEKLLSSIF